MVVEVVELAWLPSLVEAKFSWLPSVLPEESSWLPSLVEAEFSWLPSVLPVEFEWLPSMFFEELSWLPSVLSPSGFELVKSDAVAEDELEVTEAESSTSSVSEFVAFVLEFVVARAITDAAIKATAKTIAEIAAIFFLFFLMKLSNFDLFYAIPANAFIYPT